MTTATRTPAIDFRRATITHPDSYISRARFVFHESRAAAWVEDTVHDTATRVLYATDASFTTNRRQPHIVTLPDGSTWQVTSVRAGCGCAPSPLKRYSASKLLDPDFDNI